MTIVIPIIGRKQEWQEFHELNVRSRSLQTQWQAQNKADGEVGEGGEGEDDESVYGHDRKHGRCHGLPRNKSVVRSMGYNEGSWNGRHNGATRTRTMT